MKFRGINRGIQPKASRVSLSALFLCGKKWFLCVCLRFPFLMFRVSNPILRTELSLKFSKFSPLQLVSCVCVVVVSLEEKDDDDEFKEEISTKR